jgi:hypothetical protein
MVARTLSLFATVAALLFATGAALAQDVPVADQPARPRLVHAPISVANAHERILVYADIGDPELLDKAFVVYRIDGAREDRAVELRRSSEQAGYVAEIPAKDALSPGLGYTIEFWCSDGARFAAFATRTMMHHVAVAENYLDLRERALAERLGGKRSVVAAEAEYVSFGESEGIVLAPSGALESRTVHDQYYRVEGSFTYRPLRFITEFASRVGVLRGQSPVPLALAERGDGAFDVGLDYIAQSVRFRIVDPLHVDVEGLTGITEEGFRLGLLSRLLIGDPYGSKLVLGAQGIQGFGARFWSRVDIRANDRLIVSPIIEATNWPHADAYGVRLLAEIAYDVGAGVGVVATGGYQARRSTSGGPSGALSLRYAF